MQNGAAVAECDASDWRWAYSDRCLRGLGGVVPESRGTGMLVRLDELQQFADVTLRCRHATDGDWAGAVRESGERRAQNEQAAERERHK